MIYIKNSFKHINSSLPLIINSFSTVLHVLISNKPPTHIHLQLTLKDHLLYPYNPSNRSHPNIQNLSITSFHKPKLIFSYNIS